MNHAALILIAFSLVTACSSGAISPTGNQPIAKIVVRKTLVQKQSFFLGFSEAAQRISWFDAVDLSETAHLGASGDIISVQAMPNLDAVAIVRPATLTVTDASGAAREFSIPDQRTTQNWASAADAAAMAFVSAGADSVKVIRYLGQSTWQDETFSLPSAFSEKKKSVFVSQDGLLVLVMGTQTGSYALYSASNASANMASTALECFQSSDLSFAVKKVFLHAGSSRIFVGGKSGLLKSFLPFSDGACKPPAAWLDSSIPDQEDVSGIFAPDSSSLAVVFGGSDGARLFSVSNASVALAGNSGVVPGLDCTGILDGVKLLDAGPGFAGANLYLSLCDVSFFGIALSLKVSGLLADGTKFEKSFDETPTVDDIGALAVDVSSGDVFIQANDARGRVIKLKPEEDAGSYQTVLRENVFLRGFFD
ncbi:MAG: hypothetical protein RIQ81_2117 [Pseudomonadota bacterium]